jgi:hypothetical protein
MGDHPSQLRLLIATDNHLGVWEDDEILKHDSFNAFEEILQHAHRLRVDALLLGGDLFHENKPSRCAPARSVVGTRPGGKLRRVSSGGGAWPLRRWARRRANPRRCFDARHATRRRPTVVRTIQLLRKYVMNDNPVHIQVLSDQASNFSLCVAAASLGFGARVCLHSSRRSRRAATRA